MADRFYSVALGEQVPSKVVEGAATSGGAIELRVSDTVWASKKAVILGVEAIESYLITKETTPIA